MNKPTIMPKWLAYQFEVCRKTVASWPKGKRKAAGIKDETIQKIKILNISDNKKI
jgi:hypothetical protein